MRRGSGFPDWRLQHEVVVKVKMEYLLTLTARLGIAASVAAVGGCVSQPDPFGGDRPKPLPITISERKAGADPNRLLPIKTGDILNASSSSTISNIPQNFTPDEAVVFALQNNPTLHSVRLQRGLAEGGVVIAKTYPYNPIMENYGLPNL